jgi:RimJ/RimL family protein N-acetyltransferase
MRYFVRTLDRSASDERVDRILDGWQSDGYGLWAVERRADGAFLGFTGLANHDYLDLPEIGWRFARVAWGNGYATEAARAVIDHVFSTSPYDVLHAGARVSNPASRRVLQKCGFQWTSVALYRFPAIKTSAPCDRFRLERGIWQSLKQWGAAPNAIHAVAAE